MSVVALILIHGLFPDKFKVDSATVALVVVLIVVALVPLLESASFPGGGSVVFGQQLIQLDEALDALVADEEAQVAVDPDDPVDVARQAARRVAADKVVSEVLEQAGRSPKLALMLLSAELDRVVHHLLMGSGWGLARRRWSLREGVARLVELGVIPASATSAVDLFTRVRNAVVHGAQAHSDDDILRASIPASVSITPSPTSRASETSCSRPVFRCSLTRPARSRSPTPTGSCCAPSQPTPGRPKASASIRRPAITSALVRKSHGSRTPLACGDLRGMWLYRAHPGNPRRCAGADHCSSPTGRSRNTHGSILSSVAWPTFRAISHASRAPCAGPTGNRLSDDGASSGPSRVR